MVRDNELARLIKYAQGMGTTVRFKPYIKGSKDEAAWAIDGSEITVYVRNNSSKLDQVLSLIHELGHHKAFISNDRQTDKKVEEALDSEAKRHRKVLLNDELEGASYWEEIYKDTDCKFNINRLYKQKEFDIWSYEVYYETGEWPTNKEKREKMKELRRKYD